MDYIRNTDGNLQPPSIKELEHIIAAADLPSHARETAKKELDYLPNFHAGTIEYKNCLTYIDYLLNIPWSKKTGEDHDFQKSKIILNDISSCPDLIKEKILNHLSARIFRSNNKKILLVDDEEIALKSLSRLLAKEGYEVVTSNSGETALRIMESSIFDIVITDLRMASVGGIQVLERTRRDYPDTHVIIITGYATTETAVEAMRKGALNYIIKPVRIDELRSIIKEAFDKKSLKAVNDSILCFAGPPGTGKISAGKAVADSIGRKVAEISLAHLKDKSGIKGNTRQSGGASPGWVIQNIRKLEVANPVMILNDLDKIDQSVAAALTEVLDSEKAKNFIDNYLGIPFDLSHVIFIATVEDPVNVPPSLNSRLKILEI